jgi:hypothetical protein
MNIQSVSRSVRFVRLPALCSLLFALCFLCTGCATSLINQHYQRERHASAVKISAETDAKGNPMVWGGVDVMDIKDVVAHPLAHLGGATLDLSALYGAYMLLDKNGKKSDKTVVNTAPQAEKPLPNFSNVGAQGDVNINWSQSPGSHSSPTFSGIHAGDDVNINVSEPTVSP